LGTGKILYGLLVCLLPIWLQAQTPSFQVTHYSTENSGLSHNTVLNVSMDSHGFLWISTMDGLNRFDGLNWHLYKHDPDDLTTLSDSFIHGAAQNAKGDFWITTRNGGINKLDLFTGQITRFQHDPDRPHSIPDSPVNLIYEDSRDILWAGFFNGGIGRFDPDTSTFIPARLVRTDTGETLRSVNSLIELQDGSMILSSMYGVFYLNAEDLNAFRDNQADQNPVRTRPVYVNQKDPLPNSDHLYVDTNGTLWVGTVDKGLIPVDTEGIHPEVVISLGSGVRASTNDGMFIERDNYLLSGSANGFISLIDKKTGRNTPLNVAGIAEDLGKAKLYQDRMGNLWYYAWGSGLYHLKEQKGIRLYTNSQENKRLPSTFTLAFAEENDDGYWVGTNNGLALVQENGDVRSFKNVEGLDEISIWSMERDDIGLWIATRYQGLLLMKDAEIRKGTFRIQTFDTRNSPLLMDNVHQVMRDSRGYLWVGYQGAGIQILEHPDILTKGEPGRIIHLTDDKTQEGQRLSSNEIRKITEPRKGDIWVAFTDHGFNRLAFDGDTPSITKRFGTHTDDDVLIPHNDARSVHQQDEKTWWFATYGGGIFRWNEDDNEVLTITTSDGLPNNSVYGILKGRDQNELWMSTNLGLAVLNTSTMSITHFTETDGLQSNEFNTGAYLKTLNGKLIFGGVGGFNIIDPAEIRVQKEPPPVYLSRINLFNKPYQADTLAPFKKELDLNYTENFLSFELAAPEYTNPEKVQFTYKMQGVDEQWVEAGNRNFADYPNLSPGDYTFQVKAASSTGIWNDTGSKLQIKIRPPWWETLWFRLFVSISLLGMFAGLIRYISQRELRKELRRMEMENKLRNERERISRDLHDHVGAQLANIISGLTLVDKYNEIQQKERSEELMQSLRGDAELTIRQLRETIWALNQKELTLKAFKTQIQSWFQAQTALKESVITEITVEGDENIRLSSTQALNVFRIIQEASQNTLKYAGAETLTIQFVHTQNHLRLHIADDGTFRKNGSGVNGGYGMTNMRKRANEIGAELIIDTSDGTQISLSLPMDAP